MSELSRAYELLIRSEISLPELTRVEPSTLPFPPPPDVVIRTADVPESLPVALTESHTHQANAEQLLLRIGGVGRYLVSRGSEIVVDRAPGSSPHDVRVYLLGTCFGALLHQRGMLVLHACGIGDERGAVLFTGASGAGKSTLLGELMRRGHSMMVDDVCAITLDAHDTPMVLPSYPRTRMWGDSAAHLEVDTTDLQRTREHMDKFERQVPEQFWDEPARLRRIYHLSGSNGDELSLTELAPLQRFPMVVGNTYRSVLLDGLSMRRAHFDLATTVARQVEMMAVVRPQRSFRLAELTDLVLADLERSSG